MTFGPNDASQVITINVSGDTLVENDEDFTVTLSNPSAPATITTAVATGTIQNDDSTTLAIARSTPTSAVKDEGNSGTTPFTFTVTRSGDRSGSTTVNYAVSSTQANAADFGGSFPTGTVTFGPNDASQVITINVSGDTLVENDEDFTVTLSNPSAPATITTAVATGTIQNDDSTTLAIARSTPTSAVKDEGNSGTTPFTFTVTRSGDRSGSTTVNYAVSSTQANAADFGGSLPTGTVTFGPNDASQVITINVSGDTLVENDEDFTVTLSNPSAPATITTAVATGTIQNDDSTTLAIARSTPTSAVKDEGNSGTTPFTFTVTRSGDRSGSTTVNYAVSSTQANAADFGGSLPTGTVTFGPNDASQVITINVSGDTLVENDEDFTVTLSNPSAPATITTAVATGTIQNDDSTTLAIARSTPTSAVKDEGNSGTTPFTFTVTRSGDRSGSTTVNYAVSSTQANAADFGGSLPTGTVTFGPNDASQVITINVSGDTLVENDEDFTVTLSNPSVPATITTAVATGTIQNDDSTTLAIARSTPTSAVKDEGNSGTTPFTFTVTRSGDRSGSTTVNYAVSSTQANAADFGGSFPTGTVNFGPNDASQVITINVSGDTLVENDDSFNVILSNPTNGALIQTGSATGTILNDDTASVEFLTADSGPTSESVTTPSITLRLNIPGGGTLGDNFSVDVSTTTTGTATAGDDFTALSTTVTFQTGDGNGKLVDVPFTVLPDQIVELDETIGFELSDLSPPIAQGTIASSLHTIMDDDSATISVATTQHADESGPVNGVLTVTMTQEASTDTTVQYIHSSGTANPGKDYRGLSGFVTILAGSTSATIELETNDDPFDEVIETANITLIDVTGDPNIGLGASISDVVTFTDNDTDTGQQVTVSVSDGAVEEDAQASVNYTFTRTNTSGELTVNFSIGGSGTFNDDYTVTGATSIDSSSGTVTFSDGAPNAVVTITNRHRHLLARIRIIVCKRHDIGNGSTQSNIRITSNVNERDVRCFDHFVERVIIGFKFDGRAG